MALYHTHRPQTFSEILGQEHIKTTLRNQVLNDNVAHAYLFSGPRGVGKTTTARILAKAVNVGVNKKGEIEPSETTEAIAAGRSIDVIEIDAASHTGVDNVREQIIENAQFRPTTLDKKVFIIDEVHMLSTSAFNALLKILEEPPEYVLFVLATTEPHKLPATIISRCQRFEFRPIPFEALTEHLTNIAKLSKQSVDDDVLARIVNKSDGCARDAISLLDQVLSTGLKTITAADVTMMLPVSNTEALQSFTESLANKDQSTAITQIQTLTSEGVHMKQFSKDIIEYLRYLMIAKAGAPIETIAPDLSPTATEQLQGLTEQFTYDEILRLLDLTLKRSSEIYNAPIPSLPIEMLVIEWCGDDAEKAKDAEDVRKAKVVTEAPVEKPTVKASETSVVEPTTKATADVEEIIVQEKIEEVPDKPEAVVLAASGTPGSISKQWNNVISNVEKTAPSIVFIIKMATILSETETSVILGVSYTFHKDKLMSSEAKSSIEKAMTDVIGSPCTLDIQLTGDIPEKSAPAPDADLQKLANAFGGEIVS